MKKFMKEITLFIIQLLIFYLFPLFAKQIDAIGMVLFLITATFVLSALMGIISTNKIKYFYPLITAILFIPSVFIYYNETTQQLSSTFGTKISGTLLFIKVMSHCSALFWLFHAAIIFLKKKTVRLLYMAHY